MVAFVGVDNHARLFVKEQNILILVDDIKLCRSFQKFIMLFISALKKLVLYKKLKHVAFLEYFIARYLFAV